MKQLWKKLNETSLDVLKENYKYDHLKDKLRSLQGTSPIDYLIYDDINGKSYNKVEYLEKTEYDSRKSDKILYKLHEDRIESIIEDLLQSVDINSIRLSCQYSEKSGMDEPTGLLFYLDFHL